MFNIKQCSICATAQGASTATHLLQYTSLALLMWGEISTFIMHRTLDNPPPWIRGVCDSQDVSRQAGTAQMEMEKGGKCAR